MRSSNTRFQPFPWRVTTIWRVTTVWQVVSYVSSEGFKTSIFGIIVYQKVISASLALFDLFDRTIERKRRISKILFLS